MTKAKTKSRRVYVRVDARGRYKGSENIHDSRNQEKIWNGWFVKDGYTVPATFAWTPPAKAKKRSARNGN